MSTSPWHVRTSEQYQVFDGLNFIPYRYTKPVAVKLAKERAVSLGRATEVWKNTPSGLTRDVIIAA